MEIFSEKKYISGEHRLHIYIFIRKMPSDLWSVHKTPLVNQILTIKWNQHLVCPLSPAHPLPRSVRGSSKANQAPGEHNYHDWS